MVHFLHCFSLNFFKETPVWLGSTPAPYTNNAVAVYFTSYNEGMENTLTVLLFKFLQNMIRCEFRSYLPPQCPPGLGISCVRVYWWSAGWGPMTGLRISSEFSSADGLFHLCHGHSQTPPSSGYLAGESLYIDPTSVETPVWHRTLTRTTDQFNLL